MEQLEIKTLLETIEKQGSSSVLGGREAEYEELERLGYIRINRDHAQWAAFMTPLGRDFLSHN